MTLRPVTKRDSVKMFFRISFAQFARVGEGEGERKFESYTYILFASESTRYNYCSV